ncbi:hypothetical protein D6D12_09912 [Aureobasidium pullulans]|uniref:Uncharacterized protein n=1 Tax=Aureobasidium pullulans TaxID=5580 RepID=A0AB74JFQ2_AURPU|nr:hypothetical protein D6D12_09912 [Aureobasidium pullulans]
MEQEHERQSNVLQIMMQERRDAKAHRDLTDAKFLECPTIENVQETFSKFTKKEDFDHFKKEISAKVDDSTLPHQVQVVEKVCEGLATKDSVTSLGQTVSRLSGKLEDSTIGVQITALDGRVTSTEDKILDVQKQLARITDIGDQVKNSASKQDLETTTSTVRDHDTRITTTTSTVGEHETRITNLGDQVKNLASKQDLDVITSTAKDQDNRITNMCVQVKNSASKQDLDVITSTAKDQDNRITNLQEQLKDPSVNNRLSSAEENILAVQGRLKDPAVSNQLASVERQVSQLEANVKNSTTKQQFADIQKDLNLFVKKSVAVKDYEALTNAFRGLESQLNSLVSVESVSVLEFGELQTSLRELQTTITGLVTGEALEDVKENLLKRQRNLVRLFEMLTKTQDEASRTQAEKDQKDMQKFKDLETRMNALELARKEDLEKYNSKISTNNKSVASMEQTIAAQALLIKDMTAEVSVSTKAISSFESLSASINVSADLQTQQKNGIEEIKKTLTNVESRLSLVDSVPLAMQILTGKQSSLSKDVEGMRAKVGHVESSLKTLDSVPVTIQILTRNQTSISEDVEGVRVRVGLVESAMKPLKMLPADLQSYSLTVQNTALKLEDVLSVVQGLKVRVDLVKDVPKMLETMSRNQDMYKTQIQQAGTYVKDNTSELKRVLSTVEGLKVRVDLVKDVPKMLETMSRNQDMYKTQIQHAETEAENNKSDLKDVLSLVEGLKDGAELVKDLPKAQETLSRNHVETKTTLQGLEKDVKALRLAAATSFTNMQAAGKDLTHCVEKQTEHTNLLEGVISNMSRWVKELDGVCSQTEEGFKFAQKQTDRKASIEDLKMTKARMDSLEATFQSVLSFAPEAKTHIRIHKDIPKEVVELTARLDELDMKVEGFSMVAENLTVVETTVQSHGEILNALAEPSDDTFGDNTEAQDNQSFSGESITDDVNFDGGNSAPFQDSMSDADPDYPVQHGYEDEPDQHESLENEDISSISDDDSEGTAPSDGSRQHTNVRKRPSSTPPAEEPPARRSREGLKVWVDEIGDLVTNAGVDETWDTMLEIWESQVKYFEGKSVDWLSVNTKDRCLRSMLMKRSHNWTTEKPGDFACKGCSNENNICVVQSLGSLVVLPLPSQAVADASGILGRFVAKEKLISRKLLEKDVWTTKT